MSDIKFSCPSCGQNLEIAPGFAGRQVDCPACKKSLLVPMALKVAEATPAHTPAPRQATPPAATEESKGAEADPSAPALSLAAVSDPASKASPTDVSPKTEPIGSIPESKDFSAETGKEDASATTIPADSPAPVAKVVPLSELRVAVLTPALKLEIVRSVRSRISDPARWIPGKMETGKYQYAARVEGSESVPVEPADVTATHFSLFGAVLLEFHRRNVHKVTPDRRQFLDKELTEAIQKVLGRKSDGAPVSESERKALTHPQCLAVLDILEKHYESEAKMAAKLEVESKIERVRLVDLVNKLEHGTPLLAEDVAAALYYEVDALNQRLDRLEATQKPRE